MSYYPLLLLFLVGCFCGGHSAEQPNILFILADDLGYGDLGSYPSESENGKLDTPYLNGLAQDSMVFTDAYAGAPVCAPSRCCLMTGKHSGHCTVRQNSQVLNATDVTIASVLQKAGYRTGLIGKWGLGASDMSTFYNSPNGKGFDYFLGYISQDDAHNWYPYSLIRNQEIIYYEANKNASEKECGDPLTEHCIWAEDVFVNETIEFLTNASQQTQPFYLFLSFTTPHAGGVGSNEESGIPVPYDTSQYANKTWPKVEKDFASAVALQDQHVGQVLQALNELQLSSNTVVFYASDNGALNEGGHSYEFFQSSGTLRGYKRSLHEGGVRSPLLVRWPGVTEGGSLSYQQWGFWDFMSTAADIAGIPESFLPPNDGYSLVPTLKGKTQEQPKYMYHEYCSPNEDKAGWGQAVRFQSWKAVRYDFSDAVELYDLENDVGQEMDVSFFYPIVVKEAVTYMDDAHVPGPYCGYTPPHGN